MVEQLSPPKEPTDPAYLHAQIEAYRSIAWERDDLVADPDRSPLAPGSFLDPERIAAHLDAIDMRSTGSFPQPRDVPGGTAYMCTRDANGVAVSLIQSNFMGIGSGLSAGSTGVFLHNRGAGFTLTPGHPNEWEAGRRPLHTLSPTMWTKSGEFGMTLGTRGGQFQPQLLLHMITSMLHGGLSPAAAQHAPRWQVTGWERGGSPKVILENLVDRRAAAGLQDLGHDVSFAGDWEGGWGPVSVITHSDGLVVGAADPRVTTSAAL